MSQIAFSPSSPIEALRSLDRLQQIGMRGGGGLKKELSVLEAHIHVFEAWQRIHAGEPVLWYRARGEAPVSIHGFHQLSVLVEALEP